MYVRDPYILRNAKGYMIYRPSCVTMNPVTLLAYLFKVFHSQIVSLQNNDANMKILCFLVDRNYCVGAA